MAGDPNYGHLWASTCPDDPSWQAGEGRSSEFQYRKDPKVSQSEVHSAHIPMWPRDSVAVHGVEDPVTTSVIAWRDGDGLRVQAQFGVAARKMTAEYGMSRFALGMGVGLRRWNTLHMGVDLYLRRAIAQDQP